MSMKRTRDGISCFEVRNELKKVEERKLAHWNLLWRRSLIYLGALGLEEPRGADWNLINLVKDNGPIKLNVEVNLDTLSWDGHYVAEVLSQLSIVKDVQRIIISYVTIDVEFHFIPAYVIPPYVTGSSSAKHLLMCKVASRPADQTIQSEEGVGHPYHYNVLLSECAHEMVMDAIKRRSCK